MLRKLDVAAITRLLVNHFSPVSHSIPPENVRKPKVFLHFQGL